MVQASTIAIVRAVPAATYPGSKSVSSPAPIVVRPRQRVMPPSHVTSYTPGTKAGRPNEKLDCPKTSASVPGGAPSHDVPVIGPAIASRGHRSRPTTPSASIKRTRPAARGGTRSTNSIGLRTPSSSPNYSTEQLYVVEPAGSWGGFPCGLLGRNQPCARGYAARAEHE